MGSKKKEAAPQEPEEIREETAAKETPDAETAPAEPVDPRDETIEKLKKELEALKDQHLRTLAEYDNYRKRTEKEKTGIYNDAVVDTVANILPIGDNIERALAQKDCSAEDMYKGVELIYQQFKASLGKLGVEEMAGEGEAFDPALHNAVAHIEDENLEEGVISAVFQKGYLLRDKVVRHAMVQVAN